MKTCCVIIVTYNGEKWLDVCLPAFKTANKEDIAVVVVDNASKDKTCEKINKEYPFVKLFSCTKNLGFGQANNVGIKYAYDNDFRHVFLLNQDAKISIKDLYKICEIQDLNNEYYCLSPIHYNKENQIDSLFHNNLVNSGITDITDNNYDKYVREIGFCNAALWCLSRKCIEDIGGFSPSFFHYGEDNNYVDRIHYYGGKIGVVPSVKAYHYRENPRSKNKFFTDKFKSNYRYMLQQLSNPNYNNKYMIYKFYRKLVLKLLLALITIDLKRIKRNFDLIMALAKNYHEIKENKKRSQSNTKLCFLNNIDFE